MKPQTHRNLEFGTEPVAVYQGNRGNSHRLSLGGAMRGMALKKTVELTNAGGSNSKLLIGLEPASKCRLG
jgi:hypothetical protein